MTALSRLRAEVLAANIEIDRRGLVTGAFGNASGVLRGEGLVVIKPSGVPYAELTADLLVVVDLEGHPVEGALRPSSDLATHLVLYRAFPTLGGVVHTHSRFATVWAQAGREIPCLGTTHADYFRGAVPITAPMTDAEILCDYERHTGDVIVRRFAGLDPVEMPAVLVSGHGPFCWGASPEAAAHLAVMLEEVACMAWHTLTLAAEARPLSTVLSDKHFLRKHGPDAYYGQVR